MLFQFDPRIYRLVDQETITVGSSSVGFTVSKLVDVTDAMFRVNDQPLRFEASDKNNTPTASSGFSSVDGDVWQLTEIKEVQNFKAIRKGGTNSEIDVIYLQRIG